MSVPVFCCFCISKKLFWKYSRNWTKPGQDFLFFQHVHGVQRRYGGEPRASHTMGRRGPPLPRRGVVWAPRASPAAALSPIYSSRHENPKYPSHYPRKVSETPPPSTLAQEGPEPLPDTLPERGIITGGLYIAMPASGVMRE